MELTIQPVGRHDLRDILLGFDLEGWSQKEGGGGCTLVVLLTIWLHKNNKLFRGRAGSTDGVAYALEGLVAAWSSRP